MARDSVTIKSVAMITKNTILGDAIYHGPTVSLGPVAHSANRMERWTFGTWEQGRLGYRQQKPNNCPSIDSVETGVGRPIGNGVGKVVRDFECYVAPVHLVRLLIFARSP